MIKSILYKLWSKFLIFFGNIKIFKFPFWIVYDPSFFQMTGDKIIEVLSILKPGDVLLRKYNNYLDSRFIKGDYSHGAIYIGNNIVIHAVAPTISKINIIDFMECDGIAIYRSKTNTAEAIEKALNYYNNKIPYDFNFSSKDNNALYCFELVAYCYSNANIPTYKISKFCGLIKKEVYLSDSFKNSNDFELVFEYNPNKNIYYKK